MGDKRLAVQTRITSMLAWPATIVQVSMTAPAGYDLEPMGPELIALYPMKVPRSSPSAIPFADIKIDRGHASLERPITIGYSLFFALFFARTLAEGSVNMWLHMI
jgi:hypothetical protein